MDHFKYMGSPLKRLMFYDIIDYSNIVGHFRITAAKQIDFEDPREDNYWRMDVYIKEIDEYYTFAGFHSDYDDVDDFRRIAIDHLRQRMDRDAKPKIHLVGIHWFCRSPLASGFGLTPKAAFDNWERVIKNPLHGDGQGV